VKYSDASKGRVVVTNGRLGSSFSSPPPALGISLVCSGDVESGSRAWGCLAPEGSGRK